MEQQALGVQDGELDEVWLLTSPSYFGFEGINPLSVWFCYSRDRHLKLVLLEVGMAYSDLIMIYNTNHFAGS